MAEFEEDPRFRQSLRGAAAFAAFYVGVAVVTLLLGFTLGRRPAEEMAIIFGFPDWVFITLILWQAIVVGLLAILLRFSPHFAEVPLTPSGAPEDGIGGEE